MEVAGANRRWRCPFRFAGGVLGSAVAQFSSLGIIRVNEHTHRISRSRSFGIPGDCLDVSATDSSQEEGWSPHHAFGRTYSSGVHDHSDLFLRG